MMKKLKKLLAVLLVCAEIVMFSGCSAEKITVGYTIYPMEYVLKRIAGNYIDIKNLSDGVNPIQVSQIASDYKDSLDKAHLILKVGDLEPYWTIYEGEIKSSDAEIIDLSALAAIYDFKRYTTGEISGSKVVVESDWYEGGLFNMTDTYGKDMGIWMDPIALTSMARTVLEWLSAKDPTNAAVYNANFRSLEGDLVRLDSEYSLLSSMGLKLVTVTPSFGNWQKDYNIGIYPLILSRYGALPTDEQLQVIESRIQADGVKYILKESNMTEAMTALYERVKEDCGLTEVNLSNLSTLTQNEYNQNKDYLTIMYENLTTLENLADDGE